MSDVVGDGVACTVCGFNGRSGSYRCRACDRGYLPSDGPRIVGVPCAVAGCELPTCALIVGNWYCWPHLTKLAAGDTGKVKIAVTEAEAREWYERVASAIGEDGSNDDEHDLLIEMSDLVGAAIDARIEWDDQGQARVEDGR